MLILRSADWDYMTALKPELYWYKRYRRWRHRRETYDYTSGDKVDIMATLGFQWLRSSETSIQDSSQRLYSSNCSPVHGYKSWITNIHMLRVLFTCEAQGDMTYTVQISMSMFRRIVTCRLTIATGPTSALSVSHQIDVATPKRKCHFDEIFINSCTGSCQNGNFRCSQWWKFRQNDDISVSLYRRKPCTDLPAARDIVVSTDNVSYPQPATHAMALIRI